MKKFDKYEKLGAYHFKWYQDPNYAWYKECVDRIVDFCRGSTIDAGGGDGLVSHRIGKNGYLTLVLDNTGYKAWESNRFDWAWWAYCDLESVESIEQALEPDEVSDGKFEYMACLNVIEHLENPQGLLTILRNNITKGAIIITDKPTGHPGRYHEREYTKAELMETFKEFKPKYFQIKSTEFGKPITFHGVEVYK